MDFYLLPKKKYIYMLGYDAVRLNYPKFLVNSHNVQIFKISKIPKLNFPWSFTRNFSEIYQKFSTPLQT